MAILSTYGGSHSPYYSKEYNSIDELLEFLPDNYNNLIDAGDVRNSVYTLWNKIEKESSSLEIIDDNSGQTFSNIESIVFKGNTVTTPSGGTDGVLASGGGAPSRVVVWIPAPIYVDSFNPNIYGGPYNRYISEPDENQYYDINSGNEMDGVFNIGDWTPATDMESTSRNVTNSREIGAFSDTEFSLYNLGTTMSFEIFDGFGDKITSIDNLTLDVATTTQSFINGEVVSEITLNNIEPDNDRYKADIEGRIYLDSLLSNGGRFSYKVTHYNVIETIERTSSEIFYDSPYSQDGSSSSSSIGSISFDEQPPLEIRYYSGVAFYDMDSRFSATASGINDLNELTIPTDKQIDIISHRMLITSTYDGIGDDIDGWSINWDSSGLTYSRTIQVNSLGQYIPNYESNNSNLVDTTPSSYIESNIYDYGIADSTSSNNKLMLFDTVNDQASVFDEDPIVGESNRLLVGGITTSGNAAFDSHLLPEDELQYLFGRIIYPQQDFTQFYPSVNSSSSVDYTSLPGSNKTFEVYESLDDPISTGNITFNDYRWYVSAFGADSSYSSSFANGLFTFNSNFTEDDLHYNVYNSQPGNGDLVFLIGIDSSGDSQTPDRFIWITAKPTDYPGRQSGTTYHLGDNEIQWTKGSGTPTVKKIWLLIGFKNSIRGKELQLSNIMHE